MSDVVFTLAVWDVRARQWMALATSPERSRVEALDLQLGSHVMVFSQIVEVPRSDDDAVVAALAMLPKVHPKMVARVYGDFAMYCYGLEVERESLPPVAN